MDKSDIYEHLANIYLDSSRKKKAQSKESRPFFKNLFLISLSAVLGLALFIIFNNREKENLNNEVALIIQTDAVKINYNFNSVKKEAFSINLNNLNLSGFKALGFNLRKTDSSDVVYLRVELVNTFKEVSEIYLKDVRYRWKTFRIDLRDFKNISDWSDIEKLSFIVEEWNTKNKNGVVYIDEIKFIR